jgi:serine/threonine protein kinase
MLNNYARYARIGNGHHGEVFLCFRIDPTFPVNDVRRWFPVVSTPCSSCAQTSDLPQAMKSVRRDTVIDKYSRLKANRIALTAPPGPSEPGVVDRLNTTELKIKKEIAIMKKLSHPNVVRLFEVIDDRMKEKVYMGACVAVISAESSRLIAPWQSWNTLVAERLNGALTTSSPPLPSHRPAALCEMPSWALSIVSCRCSFLF